MIFDWNLFILLSMIFLHIIDDYGLQGIMKDLKQKQWWQKNAPDQLYRYDYIVALIMHSFSWTFMIMIPITLASIFHYKDKWSIFLYIINIIIHAITDDLKANQRKINLIEDQTIHILQIILTWFLAIC